MRDESEMTAHERLKKQLADARAETDKYKSLVEFNMKELDCAFEKEEAERERASGWEIAAKLKGLEIIELKAKLYDLIK